MKQLLLFFLVFTFFSMKEKGKLVKQENFKKAINEFGLVFNMPVGFKEIRINEASDYDVQFAIRNNKTKIEVYYDLVVYDSLIAKKNKCLQQPDCMIPEPENQFREIYNRKLISINKEPNYKIADMPERIKKDMMNCESGSYCLLSLPSADIHYNKSIHIFQIEKKEKVNIIVQLVSPTPLALEEIPENILTALHF